MIEYFVDLIIDGIKTKYTVSNYGKIFDNERKTFVIVRNNEYVTQKSKRYVLGKDRPNVELNINGKYLHTSVGRVVLLAFDYIDNYKEMEADHLDGDPTNNFIGNLEWVTHEENMKRAANNNLMKYGENHHNSKYSNALIHRICELISEGFDRSYIIRECNVNGQLIDDIKSGRSHTKISSLYVSRGFTYNIKNIEQISERRNLARKICEYIENGLTNKEIIDIMKLQKEDLCLPNDIRKHRVYKYISKDFSF